MLSCLYHLLMRLLMGKPVKRPSHPLITYSSFHLCFLFLFLFFVVLACLGTHLRPIEVPRLGAESERQLSCQSAPQPQHTESYDLCLSLCQCQILNPLSEARDWTPILMDTSQVHNLLSHNRKSTFWPFRSLVIIVCSVSPVVDAIVCGRLPAASFALRLSFPCLLPSAASFLIPHH